MSTVRCSTGRVAKCFKIDWLTFDCVGDELSLCTAFLPAVWYIVAQQWHQIPISILTEPDVHHGKEVAVRPTKRTCASGKWMDGLIWLLRGIDAIGLCCSRPSQTDSIGHKG